MSNKKLIIGKKTFTPLGGRIDTLLSAEGISGTAFAGSLKITDAYLSRLMHVGGKGGDKFWRNLRKAFPHWETYLRMETDKPPSKQAGFAAEGGPGQMRLVDISRYKVTEIIGAELAERKKLHDQLEKILESSDVGLVTAIKLILSRQKDKPEK